MGIRTGDEYRDSLRDGRPASIRGERAGRVHKLPEAPENLAGIRATTLVVLDEVGGVLDRFGSETAPPPFGFMTSEGVTAASSPSSRRTPISTCGWWPSATARSAAPGA
jgi:hypothetical protein